MDAKREKKKLHLIDLGRARANFAVGVDADCTLMGLCEEYDHLRRIVSAYVRSEPDFQLSNDETHIGIFAGWNLVGVATFMTPEEYRAYRAKLDAEEEARKAEKKEGESK